MAITITPTVGSTCTVGSPATIAITGLTANTAYTVQKQDPSGGSHYSLITSDPSGAITTSTTPTTSGTLSVSVFPVTQFAQTSSLPQATFPSIKPPSLLIGTAVLSTVLTFTAISGE